MANQIFVDGIDFTESTRFPDGFQVTYSVDNSSKTVNVGISSGIVFEREAFNYLENRFFPSPFNAGAKDRESMVTIIEDICGEEYEFIIRADAVTYCPGECLIETEGFERSEDNKASIRLRNHRILTDQQGIISQVSPKIPYCVESNFFQSLLYTIMAALLALFLGIALILSAFGWNAFENALNSFLARIQGCFGSIRTFYLKDIFEEAANDAGLVAQSSILQTQVPYSNAVWLDTRAIPRNENAGNFLNEGQSFLFANGWLDILSQTFNADWIIKNGVLLFERVDFFNNTSVTLVNANEAYNNELAENAPCYTYTDQLRPAYGRYEYTKDDAEDIGNEALELYNDVIEFNDPFDQNKQGVFNVNIPLAAARFIGDQLPGEILYGSRSIGDLVITVDLASTRSLPKILVITGSSAQTNDPDWLNAKVIKRSVNLQRQYNYPMWMTEGDPDSLYENFWKITDPRETPSQPYELEDFEFCFSCEQIRKVRENGIDVLVETELGNGTPGEVVIDYDKKTITVKETKLAQ